MFIIDLQYIAPLEKIDRHMPEHMKFLRKYYAMNKFLVSGRKVPRTGGIIVCTAGSKDEAERIICEDPFVVSKLAQYTITEFLASQSQPALKNILR
ncbi:MAG: GTP cyclohydrolase [Bacteroidetes bacterium]|nr:GTP cyclohydrolase [Bacteroidota bacterium]